MPDPRGAIGSGCLTGDTIAGSAVVCSVCPAACFLGIGRRARYAKMISQPIRSVKRLLIKIACDIVKVFGMSTGASSFRPFLAENSILLLLE
jgi:hypothetical protein